MEATFFYNGMAGAPSLGTASAGDCITLLDACLVNGFNTVTLTSITRSSNTATATYTSHGYKQGQLVTISGANEADYNGVFRVLTVPDANTFTFTVANTPATPATGTISCKTTPLGWTKEYSGTNLAAYRAPAGNRRYLRVDDTPTNNVIVLGYNTMTAISSGSDPFPNTTAVAANGYRVAKPNDTNGWIIVGDDRRFFMLSAASTTYWSLLVFGDMPSYKSGDTDNTIIHAAGQASDAAGVPFYLTQVGNQSSTASHSATTGPVLYRDYTGLGTVGALFSVHMLAGSSTSYYPAMSTTSVFTAGPSTITGGYHFGFVEILERISSANQPRFRLAGYIQVLNNIDHATLNKTVLPNAGGFPFVLVTSCTGLNGGSGCGFVFPLGDWETIFATGI
jgi:hypothetical protein